jgi:hypothetical protein
LNIEGENEMSKVRQFICGTVGVLAMLSGSVMAAVTVNDVVIKGQASAEYTFSSSGDGVTGWNQATSPAYILTSTTNNQPAAEETATASFTPATSGMYDMTWYGLMRSDFPPDGHIRVTYKPGGAFELVPNQVRVVSVTNNNAGGVATIACSFKNTSALGTFDRDQIYLGRYELVAGQTYTITQTTEGATPACWWHVGYMAWGGPRMANPDLVYNDVDAMVGEEYWGWAGGGADYFWRGHYKPEGILRGAKVYALPGADRSASGSYDVYFEEVYGGATDQPWDTPVTVYFDPGTAGVQTPPVVDGTAITGADLTTAAQGYITVRVNIQSARKVLLGRFVMMAGQAYAVEVRDFPVDNSKISGTDIFLRKFNVSLENYSSTVPVELSSFGME